MALRLTGIVFLLISALLYASRYIAAAIAFAHSGVYDQQVFYTYLGYVGPAYWVMALSLLIGLLLIFWPTIRSDLLKIRSPENN